MSGIAVPENDEQTWRNEHGDRRPIPDPSTLTTDALERAVTNLRELLNAEMEGQRQFVAARFTTVDKTFDNLERQRIEQKADAKEAISAALLASEKAIQEAFEAREKALAAALESKDKAVAAAFEASEKAIAKAEVSIEKRADATYVALGELQRLLSSLMPRAEAETRFRNQDNIIADLKERLSRTENMTVGGRQAEGDRRQSIGTIIAVVGSIVGVVGLLATIITILIATR